MELLQNRELQLIQPRSQALSSMRGRGGETLVGAGHVPPRFWEVN